MNRASLVDGFKNGRQKEKVLLSGIDILSINYKVALSRARLVNGLYIARIALLSGPVLDATWEP